MSIKNFLMGCLVGGVSGLLSVLSSMSLFLIFYAPGIIFGLVTLQYFAYIGAFTKSTFRAFSQAVSWVILCSVSYFLAVLITLRGPKDLTQCDAGVNICDPAPMAYFIGGLVGATLVVMSYHFLIKKLSFSVRAICILSGGILPLLLFLPLLGDGGYLTLFVGWQAGVFGLLNASPRDK